MRISGQNIYFHLNHPIRYIYLIGVVVEIDFWERFAILTIDDGSGAVIEVKVARVLPVKNQGEGKNSGRAANISKQDYDIDHTLKSQKGALNDAHLSAEQNLKARRRIPVVYQTAIPELKIRHDEEYDLMLSSTVIRSGSVLKIKGTPSTFRKTFQISLLRIFIVLTTAEEAAAWADYADFCTKVLCRPWVLTGVEIKELEAADKLNSKKERERAQKNKEKEEMRKKRKKEWEEKVRRHEARAERRRANEAKVLDGNALEVGLKRNTTTRTIVSDLEIGS